MIATKILPAVLAVGGAAAVSGAGYLIANKPQLSFGGSQPIEFQPSFSEVVPSRAQQLEKLRKSSELKPFDLLIIGGGSTGAGTAVDAATRGLRTALVEREDFGSGTSSKSTKLVHGGVRYLEKAVFQLDIRQLRLVFEALAERRSVLDNAPHLTSALPILTPCYSWWQVSYYWAGLKAYDLVAGTHNLVLSKYVGPAEVQAMMPTLAPAQPDGRSLKGAVMYYDGQFDDARLNVALACSAAAAGGAILNYTEVTSLIKNADGKVVGARVTDRLSGESLDVHAKVVVNATGPFVDGVRALSDPQAAKVIQPSAGAHVTLPAWYGSSVQGLIIPKTKDGRVVFLLPWQGAMVAGTTDEPCTVTPRPLASGKEVDFILEALRDYLGIEVRRSDVLSVWSGIRPLAADPRAKDTQNVVRDHVVFEDSDGLITASGGKWTTYRRIAQDVVDTVVSTGRMPLNARPCTTQHLKLLGAQSYGHTFPAQLAQEYSTSSGSASSSRSSPGASSSSRLSISAETAEHLARAYGDRARRVLDYATRSPQLAKPLVQGHPYIEAEVAYCMSQEYCASAEDFLARRTRLAFLDAAAALQALPRVVELMADEQGWDRARRESETISARHYLSSFLAPVDLPSSQASPAMPQTAGG